MGKADKFIKGLLGGAAVGMLTAILLAPESGDGIRKSIRERIEGALEEARQAAAEQRAALEEELARLQGNSRE